MEREKNINLLMFLPFYVKNTLKKYPVFYNTNKKSQNILKLLNYFYGTDK